MSLLFLARDLAHREHLKSGKDDTPIQNLIDTAVETYLSTLYKLRFLN